MHNTKHLSQVNPFVRNKKKIKWWTLRRWQRSGGNCVCLGRWMVSFRPYFVFAVSFIWMICSVWRHPGCAVEKKNRLHRVSSKTRCYLPLLWCETSICLSARVHMHTRTHTNTQALAIQKQMQKPTDNQASITLHLSVHEHIHTLMDGFQKVEQIKEWNNLCCLSTIMESDLRTSTYEEGNKGFGCH